MDIAAIRAQIPTTQKMTYLNTGWAGPSPVSVVDAVRERMEMEQFGARTALDVVEGGQAVMKRAREATAGLLGCASE
ncbi:MAG: hypothetical protein FJ319_11630 [SAR202 cluster bacterium]|nr:hypothetical protein [SAR202 cluster bacterium]